MNFDPGVTIEKFYCKWCFSAVHRWESPAFISLKLILPLPLAHLLSPFDSNIALVVAWIFCSLLAFAILISISPFHRFFAKINLEGSRSKKRRSDIHPKVLKLASIMNAASSPEGSEKAAIEKWPIWIEIRSKNKSSVTYCMSCWFVK